MALYISLQSTVYPQRSSRVPKAIGYRLQQCIGYWWMRKNSLVPSFVTHFRQPSEGHSLRPISSRRCTAGVHWRCATAQRTRL